MIKRDARKLTTSAKRELRERAVSMKLNGSTFAEISAHLDVSITALQNWMKLYHEGGFENLELLRRGRPKGSCRTLSRRQEAVVQRLIEDKTPDQLKMPFALWTRGAIRDLIKSRYGIVLPIRTLGHYLKRWGFTPQKPKRYAYEQQPEEVRSWLDREYPRIARKAKQEDADILWGDETGLSNQDQTGRGYAPRGRTPLSRGLAKRCSTSMISAISNKGEMRFMVYKGALRTGTFIRFLERLIKGADRKVLLIVDNLRVHRAVAVQKWVQGHRADIELCFLPPYAPELNPDEYLNQAVKAQLRNKPVAETGADLAKRLRSQMRSNQKRKGFVASLFHHPAVQYAA